MLKAPATSTTRRGVVLNYKNWSWNPLPHPLDPYNVNRNFGKKTKKLLRKTKNSIKVTPSRTIRLRTTIYSIVQVTNTNSRLKSGTGNLLYKFGLCLYLFYFIDQIPPIFLFLLDFLSEVKICGSELLLPLSTHRNSYYSHTNKQTSVFQRTHS